MNLPYVNSELFSTAFLNSFIPTLKVEEKPFHKIKEIYEQNYSDNLNEAQLEQNIIEPVLKVLGWHFIRQPKSNIHGQRKTPDYALFTNEKAKKIAIKQNNIIDNANAILEVKKPNTNLDNAVNEQQAPHFQLIYYLTWLKPKYGILTNGKLWRLYIKHVNKGPKTFYQIDIFKALQNPENFKFFFNIFNKNAFYETKQEQNTIENIIIQSELYSTSLENNLRNIIYNQWLEFVGQFLYKQLNEKPETIYNTTLLLLFRLIFIAYAEARHILPIENNHYYKISLFNTINQALKNNNNENLYQKIKNLFEIIDKGDAYLKIPPYNGGLFSATTGFSSFFLQEKILLNKINLPNEVTKKILTSLFVKDNQILDFSSLDTKKIGSIYEGLTEYTFKIAHENMLVIKEKDIEFLVPESLYNDKKENIYKIYQKGELFLTNNKGFRKITGTYYTPDDFVEFIVKKTIDKEVNSILQKYNLSDKTPEEAKIIKKAISEELLNIKILDPSMGSGHFLVSAIRYLTNKIISITTELNLQDIYKLIEQLRQELKAPQEIKDAELLQRIVAKRCIYGVDINPLAVELAKLSIWLETTIKNAPLSFLSHHLKTGNSLIGENVNIFLNKIKQKFQTSIFFTQLIKSKLNNAIKKLEKIKQLKDTSADEVHKSAQELEFINRQIEPIKILLDIISAQKHKQFKKQAELFNPLNHTTEDFILLLFTNGKPEPNQNITVNGKNINSNELLQLLEQIQRKLKPFHFELEFPDVAQQNGFNIIIGNPPWDKVQPEEPLFFAQYEPRYRQFNKQQKQIIRNKILQNQRIKQDYQNYVQDTQNLAELLKSKYKYIIGKSKTNLYKTFLARAYQLLKPNGFLGFVIPGSFINEGESTDLRKFFLNNLKIEYLLQFENRKNTGSRFFPEVDPRFKILIILAQKGLKTEGTIKTCFLKNDNNPLNNESEHTIDYSVELLKKLSPQKLAFFELQSQKDIQILNKLYKKFPRLNEEHQWKIELKVGELDMRAYRNYFYETYQPGDIILYEGKMIEQYRADFKEPRYFLNPEEMKNINKLKLENGTYIWQYFRVACRRIARNTDARTLITTLLPKNSLVGNSINVEDLENNLSIEQKLYTIAYFNTFLCDYIIRFMVAENIKTTSMSNLPFPSIDTSSELFKEVVLLSGSLICYREEFSEVAEQLGKNWKKFGIPLEKQRDRLHTRAKIDLIFAKKIFGLNYTEYEHILNAVKTKGGKSKLEKTMNIIKNRALELW